MDTTVRVPAQPAAPPTTAGSGLRGLQHWLVDRTEGEHLELVCAEHPDPAPGDRSRVVVRLSGCAGELDTAELVELLILGAGRVTVRIDGCADRDSAAAHLRSTIEVLEAGGVDRLHLEPLADDDAPPVHEDARRHPRGPGRRRDVLDAAQMPVSRRRLFGLGGSAGPQVPLATIPSHERLVAAVRTLVTPGPALEAVDAPALRLTARGCTACGVCVQACPVDALQIRHGAGGDKLEISTLLQDPPRCDGCRRCVELCPTHVLGVAGQQSWATVLRDEEVGVATVTTALCARCSTSFPVSSGERYCAVCAYRRKNPFGSTIPPGVLAPTST